MALRSGDTVLGALRARIAALERGGARTVSGGPRALPLGMAEVDGALPGGGLALGRVHEIAGADAAGAAAATGFTVAVLVRLGKALKGKGPARVLWCLRGEALYGPGLVAFGFDPERLIVVRAHRRRDVLWAMEEGLRCRALAAVVGEVEDIRVKECRRLQLAAEAGGATGFLLREGAAASPRPASGSGVTSWRVAPAPSPFPGGRGKGSLAARWRVDLVRCRGGVPGAWLVDWNDETGDFTVAAALRDGPARSSPGGGRRDGSGLAG